MATGEIAITQEAFSALEMLENAREHCFFAGTGDSGAELCKSNTPFGIAGIQYIQKLLGMKPDATFISSPDMTITRNETRWKSGFGYGGKVTWGDGSDELIILDVKPNACGMLTGGLAKLPDIDELIERLHYMESKKFYLDGIEIEWDFFKSNHFIDIFEVFPAETLKRHIIPRYAFIIHGSPGEFRADNIVAGFGIYYDKSKTLRDMAEQINTPFGQFSILTGDDAVRYHDFYLYLEDFGKKKREMAAEILFGDYLKISNETHQGLNGLNEILFGCHSFNGGSTLYPLALRADLPAYLVEGIPNYSKKSIESLGFEARAKRLGVYDRLHNANILPHGGGYLLPDVLSVSRIIDLDGKRYFELEMQNDKGKQIVSELKEMPYEYRGKNVVLRAIELETMEIVYKLQPKFALKI